MTTSRPVAIVTGASSGIGRASARAFADAGYLVVGTSRAPATAPTTPGVEFRALDVTSNSSVSELVSGVVREHGRLDVVVNNAGVGALGAAEENSIEQSQYVFDVNVFGPIRMANAALPHMRTQGSGRIVNVSSVLGLIPAPHMAIYSATKHALEGYSESLDHEVREYGIRVVLVEPAYTTTGFEGNSIGPDNPIQHYAHQDGVAAEVLAKAMQVADDPQVVAKVVVLASTASNPKPRYTAGRLAARVSVLRRLAPSRLFDQQIRKLNKLP